MRHENHPMQSPSSIHAQFREALRPLVVNQCQLAKSSGVAQPNISRWLSGSDYLSVHSLEKLTATLGVRIKIETKP